MKIQDGASEVDTKVNLTPEVQVGSTLTYLIRIDGDVVGYADTEASAKLILDSFAAREVVRMTTESFKVLREDLQDGKKIVLSTQSLGWVYNSSVTPAMNLDFIVAPYLHLLKGRHALPAPSSPIPIPPPPPPRGLGCVVIPEDDATESESEAEWDSDSDGEREEEMDA